MSSTYNTDCKVSLGKATSGVKRGGVSSLAARVEGARGPLSNEEGAKSGERHCTHQHGAGEQVRGWGLAGWGGGEGEAGVGNNGERHCL